MGLEAAGQTMFVGEGSNMTASISFTLNGQEVSYSGDTERLLLWVLRTDFGLTGTKYGCGEGHCGACTVLVNDAAVLSCQTTVGEVADAAVTTIEGIAKNGGLHSLQAAFMEKGALQCGFCTPGMILRAYSLLQENPNPTQEDIAAAMDGNICRCGAHGRILAAVADAAGTGKGGAP